jgi:hypothetical protein
MKKSVWFIAAALLLSVRLIAQTGQEAPKIKFEKVSEEELAMKSYPNDTTAEAVILYDEGESTVKLDVNKGGWMLNHERFVRIKILKQSGVEWGNFRIALYSNGNVSEDISALKGTTMNLENGKVVKSELKKSAIFKERENKYFETVRLSMPSVKVGSVVDLQYKIYTELTWNLRSWKFQYTIPVKWSQYKVAYPEYFNYNQSSLGYHRLLYNRESSTVETVRLSLYGNSYSDNYKLQVYDFAAKDVPALKPEPYMTSLENFTTRVKFELSNTNFTRIGGKSTDYAVTWNDVAEILNSDGNFGLQLQNSGFVNDVVKALTQGITGEQKKLEIIFSHLQRTMKWNNSNSIAAGKDLKKAYSDKSGNSADINLLLVAMLNSAGIYAQPVILSTRPNGIISPLHASLSDCNYVIVKAMIDKKPLLLDATEPNLQAGYIPFRCLNGEGHLMAGPRSEPVTLTNPKSIENTNVQLELKDGKITGIVQKNLTGLSAFDLRDSVKSAGSKEEHFNKLKNSSAEIDYLECQYENLDSLSKPVQLNYKIAMKEGRESNAGIIYIDPVIIDRLKENPFRSPERVFPVDFGAPFMKLYNFQLTIPAGYTVDEIPQSKSLALPGKGGTFVYQVTKEGDKISLSFSLSINKALFLPAEYPLLKTFYDMIINNQSEQIILKKTTV